MSNLPSSHDPHAVERGLGASSADPSPCPPDSPREIVRRLGPVSVLAILASTMPLLGGFALLFTLNQVGPWLKELGDAGVALYIGGFAVCAGLAVLPTYAQAVLGGWAFGFTTGFLAALAGFLGGAMLGYAVARGAAGERVTQLLREHPRWQAVYDALLGSSAMKTFLIITLIRLPLNSPFAISNLVLAATKVPIGPFVLGTLVGMAPRTALAVWIATRINVLTTADLQDSFPIWWSIIPTVIVVAIIGVLANRAITRYTAPCEPGAAPAPRSQERWV